MHRTRIPLPISGPLLLAGLLFGSATLGATTPKTLSFQATLDGQPVADLQAGDLEVTLDGRPVTVAFPRDAASAGGRRVVVYLDQALLSAENLQRAAAWLGATAGALVRLGSVEIVSADPQPQVVLPSTAEPAAVAASLNQAALTGEERNSLRSLRDRFFRRLRYLLSGPGDLGTTEAVAQLVAEATRAEEALLTRQQDWLLSWLGAEGGAEAGAVLVLVSDGYDLEPRTFYLNQLPEGLAASVSRLTTASALSAATATTARTLAALGWTVLVLAPGELAQETPPQTDTDRFRQSGSDTGQVGSPQLYSTTLERLRRRLKGGEEGAEPVGPLLLAPEEPLGQWAAATGGSVVRQTQALGPALEALETWSTFTVPVPDEGVHELALRSTRPRVELRSPRWVSARLPEAVAAARIRRLLAGDLEGGGLEVAASVRESALAAEGGEGEAPRADLEGQVNFIERDPQGPDSRLRITIAPGNVAGPVTVTHSQGEATADEPLWSFRRQLQLLPGSDRVAVLVEDLDTGLWGGALAAQLGAIPDPALLGTGEAGEEEIARALMEAEFLPKPKALRLLLPDGEVLQGKVRFQTLVQDGKVARVTFLLDGKEVEKRDQPPFEARIQLGRLPRPHTLRAVAYDVAGRELGRDSLSLNEPGGTFRLRILSPEPGKHTGPVDVEADLDIPVGHRLDRVDFSWNDRRLATLYGPPFRQRVYVPQDDPAGFIRVVGTLDDGRVAEDVVFLNEKDFAEKLRVRLVELYTVVTDRQGRPVRGLDASQFVIRENGVEKEVAEFNDAGDLPVTLALNIDSSASMFVKLPDVKAAATEFVRGFLSGRDQALLVDFDTEPRLARELTNNLSRVIDGIEQMRAGGDTHLWESIVFSLLELQGVPGKKAVIVYSDGAEEEESLSYRVCFEFSRRLGIPIYLVVLHPGIARGDDVTASTKSFIRKLDRLAEATGGRVHYTPNTRNMTALYRQIDSELRSQVLLAYYATAAAGDEDTWRSVEVEVKDRQLKARTIAGYFPRW